MKATGSKIGEFKSYGAMQVLGLALCGGLVAASGVDHVSSAASPSAWEDPSCDFVKESAHPEPGALLQEFLKRDEAGEFLSANKWLDAAVLCPGHLPGPDTFTVIRSSSVTSQKIDKDRAEFTVIYEEAGQVTSGGAQGELSVFNPASKHATEKFEVVKTPFGWRLNLFAWEKVGIHASSDFASKRPWAPGSKDAFVKATGYGK